MQDPDKAQLILDRLESLARELGAVGADTAGVLVESYGRGAAASCLAIALTGILLSAACGGASSAALQLRKLKSTLDPEKDYTRHRAEGDTWIFLMVVAVALGAASIITFGVGLSVHLPKAFAPEWHVVKELLR